MHSHMDVDGAPRVPPGHDRLELDDAVVPGGLGSAQEGRPRSLVLPAADDGFVPLCNGKDLAGWRNPYDWGKAEVVGDEIHLTGDKKFFLVTEAKSGDFVFEGEILLPEGKANSGFMFRCHVEPNKVYGYQCEIDGSDRRWWVGQQ